MRFVLIFLSFQLFLSDIRAQSSPESFVQKDYPKLYNSFNNELQGQSATYVIAIDVSSSMSPFEQSIKKSIAEFITALPNGDFVTLIKKGRVSDFISLPHTPINNSTKNSIINDLQKTPFIEIGSDGFTMTRKIMEAINETGGYDLKYVFMFTDFEYWTSVNGYNKNAVLWASLKTEFDKSKQGSNIVAFGLELPLGNVHPEAIYKQELQNIMGENLSFRTLPNPDALKAWFLQTKANILRDRLAHIVSKKRKEELGKCQFSAQPSQGGIKYSVDCKGCQLINGIILDPAFVVSVNDIISQKPLIDWGSSKYKTINAKGILNYTKYDNKDYNEVEKLLGNEAETININVYPPIGRVKWYWALSGLLVLLCILCYFIYTCYRKVTRNWEVRVSWKNIDGTTKSVNESFTLSWKLSIGNVTDQESAGLKVPPAKWLITIKSQRNCPGKIWKKAGHFLYFEEGDLAEMEYPSGTEPQTIGPGKTYYLSSPSGFKEAEIKIKENKITYTINIY